MVKIKNLRIPGYQPVSLQIAANECIGISGVSGSGKTRLLRAIADLDEHDGEVIVNGIHAHNLPAHTWRKKVALLPAESVWWFDTIGEHFISYNDNFSTLGFSAEVMQWDAAHCSSGEKQRLSILRLLENRPELLLLDEPTANLDRHNTTQVETLIQHYLHENRAAAIWVAHSVTQLKRVAQRRFVIHQGQLQAAGHDID